ncbi:hypothetical protein BCR39DRAFT_582863 [Naematelia encephala]|uniref:EF-hand domain-containing protein n=1 Tax=Naematelia encephala TaxID=71784 RepID=A0A1Y2AN96_9TREE|nr:hypothetical protein BCR39DRAFT_582863 [Naematelia encephala]
MIRSIPFILLLALRVSAHGDHSFDLDDAADNGMSYAERHMHSEHHIDSFDLESFFQLHDLNMDGYWDEAEIQAVYGLHHHSVKEKIPQPDLVAGRTQMVVDKVLQKLDKDGDRRISLAEFVAGGNDGLPSFEGYQGLGHHYDEESEYFLHHEELYHSTPETQTDESYSHPEDIEHFRHHQHIEEIEDERERKFEGLPETADLTEDHVASDPLDEHAHEEGEGPSDAPPIPESTLQPGDPAPPPPPRIERMSPGAQPQRFQKGKEPGREAWIAAKEAALGGEYGDELGRPRNPVERLRSGVPYSESLSSGFRSLKADDTLEYK